jgi:hypothetical protein
MVQLYNTASGELLGEISEGQLTFLMDQFEEESLEDQDYYINTITLSMLAAQDADVALLAILKAGMDENGELEFRWSRT